MLLIQGGLMVQFPLNLKLFWIKVNTFYKICYYVKCANNALMYIEEPPRKE